MIYLEKLNKEDVKLFEKEMGISLENFCDIFLTIRTKSFIIDMFSFEIYLSKKHGYIERNYMSTMEFLLESYDQKLCDFIESLRC